MRALDRAIIPDAKRLPDQTADTVLDLIQIEMFESEEVSLPIFIRVFLYVVQYRSKAMNIDLCVLHQVVKILCVKANDHIFVLCIKLCRLFIVFQHWSKAITIFVCIKI